MFDCNSKLFTLVALEKFANLSNELEAFKQINKYSMQQSNLNTLDKSFKLNEWSFKKCGSIRVISIKPNCLFSVINARYSVRFSVALKILVNG